MRLASGGGDGLPTLGFRQLASRGDDPFIAFRALAALFRSALTWKKL